MSSQTIPDELRDRLAEPFDPADVKWKPQAVKGNRALAICYADVRAVMDRLDDVLGVTRWTDDYEALPDGSVICRLTLLVYIDGRVIEIRKTDVGSPSEQPDGGDRLKAAFSDALKRAAVKFGVGRYLYRLPQNWCDYDPVKKQFVSPPRLPDWAIPKPRAATKPGPNPGNNQQDVPGPKPTPEQRQQPEPSGPPLAPSRAGAPARAAMKSARDVSDLVRTRDAEWANEGRFALGALISAVQLAGVRAGWGPDMTQWPYPACVQFASDEVALFLSGQPGEAPAQLTPNPNPPKPETQKRLIDGLKAMGFQWNEAKVKVRLSEIIGREIPANAGPMYLSEAEATKIVDVMAKAKTGAPGR